MAISISIPEAASQLAELLERVKHGEEVTILEAGVDRTTGSSTQTAIIPNPGQDQGLVIIAPDLTLSYQKTSSTIF